MKTKFWFFSSLALMCLIDIWFHFFGAIYFIVFVLLALDETKLKRGKKK